MNAAATTEGLAVRCRNVTKAYRTGSSVVQALRGVDLDARSGELMLLVGPSGCGKTTLLSVLCGVLDADGGEIEVFGARIDRLLAREKTTFRRRGVGFVFQLFNLLPTLSNAENVAVPLLLQGASRREALLRAEEELVLVGLEGRGRDLPSQLSGGQQQRVAIARALVAHPRLIVCDEPTSSLDGETGASIMTMLKQVAVARERCVIVVTHDARVFKFGDRAAQMLDGRIVKVHETTESLIHG
jgi:putative ABC transport system ATP-binding protein